MKDAPMMTWGIKASLVNYVDALDDGEISLRSPASKGESGFRFEYDPSASTTEIHQFRGSVLFTGYWGSMRVEVNDPQLRLNHGRAEFALRTNSPISGERYEVIAQGKATLHEGEVTIQLTLMAAGRMVLGQQYEIGQPLDTCKISNAELLFAPTSIENS